MLCCAHSARGRYICLTSRLAITWLPFLKSTIQGHAQARWFCKTVHYGRSRDPTHAPQVAYAWPNVSSLEQTVQSQQSQTERLRPKIRHLKLYEDSVNLPVKALGEPASIRIVREKPQRLDKPPAEAAELVDQVVLEDFLRDATTKSQTPDKEEAFEMIELIRRTFLDKVGHSRIPLLQECRAVGKTLLDGFTVTQLEAYIKQPQRAPKEVPAHENLDTVFKGPAYTRSRWVAGESTFPSNDQLQSNLDTTSQYVDPNLVMPAFTAADGSLRQTRKIRVVETILRRCWNIRPLEERQARGSLVLRMDPDVLDVLLKNGDNIPRKISESNEVSIEAAPTLGIVQISGNYEACAQAAQALASYIEDVRLESFDLGPKVHLLRPNRREILDKLEQMTKTKVAVRDDQKLDVFYIGPQDTALDDVRRFLSQVREYYEQERPDAQWFAESIISTLVPYHNKACFRFFEQHEKWYRWRVKDLGTATSGTARELAMPASKSLTIRDLKNRFRSAWPTLTSNHWDSEPQQTVSAYIGSIVHSLWSKEHFENALNELAVNRKTKNRDVRRNLELLMQNRRAFAPNNPGLYEAVSQLVTDTPVLVNTIRISLKPDLPRFPSLELIASLDDRTKAAELETARLIYDFKTMDLLLPAEPVDVRFVSQTSFAAKLNNFDSALLTFLANSNLDVWGNDRLTTPQNLVLRLPSHSVGGAVPVERDASYSFASLSVHSDLKMLFQGFPLTVSTVEAGLAGGRRHELKLDLHEFAERAKKGLSPVSEAKGDVLSPWDAQFLMWYGAVKEIVRKVPT